MLGTILAAVHFGLVLRSHGLGIVIALQSNSDSGHVAIHQTVVPAQVASPEIGPQGILSHGLLAWLANEIPRIPIGAIPHVQRSLQELGTRLRRVRRSIGIWIVEVMDVLRAHSTLVVSMALLALVLSQ